MSSCECGVFVIMLSAIMLGIVILTRSLAKLVLRGYYAECHYAEYHCALPRPLKSCLGHDH